MHKIGNFLFRKRGIIIFLIIFILLIFSKPSFKSILLSFPFIFIGETIRIYSLRYSGGFTRGRKLNAPKLIKEGPYSITRNPLYLGNLFNLTGVTVAMNLNIYLSLISLLIFFTIYFLIIISEEKFLEEKFGDEYKEYKKNVPRILPNPFKFVKIEPANKFSRVLRIERDTLLSLLFLYIVLFIIIWKKSF